MELYCKALSLKELQREGYSRESSIFPFTMIIAQQNDHFPNMEVNSNDRTLPPHMTGCSACRGRLPFLDEIIKHQTTNAFLRIRYYMRQYLDNCHILAKIVLIFQFSSVHVIFMYF